VAIKKDEEKAEELVEKVLADAHDL
jgi:hypothetical protein